MRRNSLAAFVLLANAFLLPMAGHSVTVEEETSRPADGLAIRSQLQAWDKALLENTPDALKAILASEYLAGGSTTRDLYVQMLEAAGPLYTESSRDNVEIRFYGDTAVVSGQWTHDEIELALGE